MASSRGHVRLPDWLLVRTDVSIAGKIVWAVFDRLKNGNAVAYPSYETVGRMCGLSRQSVLRIVDELESKQLLEIVIVSYTGKEKNEFGFKSNLFITHDGTGTFLTRKQQRRIYSQQKLSATA